MSLADTDLNRPFLTWAFPNTLGSGLYLNIKWNITVVAKKLKQWKGVVVEREKTRMHQILSNLSLTQIWTISDPYLLRRSCLFHWTRWHPWHTSKKVITNNCRKKWKDSYICAMIYCHFSPVWQNITTTSQIWRSSSTLLNFSSSSIGLSTNQRYFHLAHITH